MIVSRTESVWRRESDPHRASDRRVVIDRLAAIGRRAVSAPIAVRVRIATPVPIATRQAATPMPDETDVVVGIVSVAAVCRALPPVDHRRRNRRPIVSLAFRWSLMG